MTVVIVHGTFGRDGTWWLETTKGGFASEIDRGLDDAGREPEVWRVASNPVRDFPELSPQAKGSMFSFWGRTPPPFENFEGRFRWSGGNAHSYGRSLAGRQLARYLETLSGIAPYETVHLIGHSHGGNLIKQATKELSSPVRIGRIALLACPHFNTITGGDGPGPTYPFNSSYLTIPGRPILNFYTPQDTVQTDIAETLPDLGLGPGIPRISMLGFEGTPIVEAFRTDPDSAVAENYEDMTVTSATSSGVTAHDAVHNPIVGRAIGAWLAEPPQVSFRDVWDSYGVDALIA
jgi:pimeloyl-ACP methyl ester carboxylesterase